MMINALLPNLEVCFNIIYSEKMICSAMLLKTELSFPPLTE